MCEAFPNAPFSDQCRELPDVPRFPFALVFQRHRDSKAAWIKKYRLLRPSPWSCYRLPRSRYNKGGRAWSEDEAGGRPRRLLNFGKSPQFGVQGASCHLLTSRWGCRKRQGIPGTQVMRPTWKEPIERLFFFAGLGRQKGRRFVELEMIRNTLTLALQWRLFLFLGGMGCIFTTATKRNQVLNQNFSVDGIVLLRSCLALAGGCRATSQGEMTQANAAQNQMWTWQIEGSLNHLPSFHPGLINLGIGDELWGNRCQSCTVEVCSSSSKFFCHRSTSTQYPLLKVRTCSRFLPWMHHKNVMPDWQYSDVTILPSGHLRYCSWKKYIISWTQK